MDNIRLKLARIHQDDNSENLSKKLIKHKKTIDTTDSTSKTILNPLEKAQVVILYEKFLEDTLSQLAKLKTLKQYLEFPPINELDSKISTIKPMMSRNLKQLDGLQG